MNKLCTRRKFLNTTALAAIGGNCASSGIRSVLAFPATGGQAMDSATKPRVVDVHSHFDPSNPNYLDEFLNMSDELNLTGCMLTLFENRKVVADAAKKHPRQIVPFGYVELDASDAVKQVAELNLLGYRGPGELEFVKKSYNDLSYFPVYELANRYGWMVVGGIIPWSCRARRSGTTHFRTAISTANSAPS
jgi:hypothetical protein